VVAAKDRAALKKGHNTLKRQATNREEEEDALVESSMHDVLALGAGGCLAGGEECDGWGERSS
jgi:hypothetical protein